MERIADFFQMAFDAVIYVIALTAIVWCSSTLVMSTYRIAKSENINTTFSQIEGTPDEKKGYTDSKGKDIYEGTLTGSCVFEDILSADKDMKISINDRELSSDELDNYRSTKAGRLNLKSKLNMDGNYYRVYSTSTDGTVSAVNFKAY